MERIEADITHNASERIDATVVKIAIALIITSFSVLHAAEATVNIQLSIICHSCLVPIRISPGKYM